MRYFIVWISLLFTATTAVAKTLTLEDAVLLSLRYNPNVINARMTRTIDRFNLRVSENQFELQYALSGSAQYNATTTSGITTDSSSYTLNPQVSLTLPIGTKLSTTLSNRYNNSNGDHRYLPTATFSVTQPLLRGAGKTIVQSSLQDAYANNEISKITLKKTLTAQINTTANTFFDLLQAKNNLKIQRLAYNDAKASVAHNKTLIRLGRLAPNDNVQPKSQLFSTQLSVTQAKNNVFNAKQNLLKSIGLMHGQTSIDVTDTITIDHTDIPDLQQSIQTALTQNLTYQQSRIQLEKEKRSLLRARDNMRWKLDLTATATLGSDTTTGFSNITNGENHTHNVGLNLTIPVRDLSLQQSLLQTSIALKKNTLLLQQERRDLILAVRNAINQLSNQKQQMIQATQAEKLAERSLALEKQKVNYGLSTALNVATLRTTLVNARINKINSQIGFLKAQMVYLELIGETLNTWDIKVRTN